MGALTDCRRRTGPLRIVSSAAFLLLMLGAQTADARPAPARAIAAPPHGAARSPTEPCRHGSRRAVIAGKRTCLRVGQHCKRSHNARYRRYGFVCRNGRLRHRTRRRNGPSGISVVTRPVPDADLELTSLAAPATVTVGDTFAYTITVTNNGPYAAYGVKIRDPLPAAVALVSYSSGCDGSTTITCAVRDATPVVITVRADVAGQIENTVTVTSDTPDPISPNNVAAVTTVALPPPMPALVR